MQNFLVSPNGGYDSLGEERYLKQKPRTNTASWLTHLLKLSWFPYLSQDQLGKEWYCPQWSGFSYIN